MAKKVTDWVTKDPTYDREEINQNHIWKRAFEISEQENDRAPIGWSGYIPRATEELASSKSSPNSDTLDEVERLFEKIEAVIDANKVYSPQSVLVGEAILKLEEHYNFYFKS